MSWLSSFLNPSQFKIQGNLQCYWGSALQQRMWTDRSFVLYPQKQKEWWGNFAPNPITRWKNFPTQCCKGGFSLFLSLINLSEGRWRERQKEKEENKWIDCSRGHSAGKTLPMLMSPSLEVFRNLTGHDAVQSTLKDPGGELDDLQRSLPTPTVLWFYVLCELRRGKTA